MTGIKTILGLGPKISNSVAQKPEGLLLHEFMLFSMFPMHLGMRQYWRDFVSLETWARSEPHKLWWQKFLRDSGGAGFWHETYSMRGGIEAIFDDIPKPVGLLNFAKAIPAHGPMFSARKRLGLGGEPAVADPVSDEPPER